MGGTPLSQNSLKCRTHAEECPAGFSAIVHMNGIKKEKTLGDVWWAREPTGVFATSLPAPVTQSTICKETYGLGSHLLRLLCCGAATLRSRPQTSRLAAAR